MKSERKKSLVDNRVFQGMFLVIAIISALILSNLAIDDFGKFPITASERFEYGKLVWRDYTLWTAATFILAIIPGILPLFSKKAD